MEIQQLKDRARALANSTPYSARRLALIFAGASVGLSLLAVLGDAVIEYFVPDTYGLDGIAMRSVLLMLRAFLTLIMLVVPPFWNLGYTRTALETARGGDPRPGTLLTGFRRFWPAVRLFLLQLLIVFALCTAAANIGPILYMFSPLAMVSVGKVNQLDLANPQGIDPTDPALMDELMQIFWPMYLIVGLVLLVLLVPVLYRLRLTSFALVDGQDKALLNIVESNRAMRKKCFWMARLDLSFWWYFLLQGLAVALAYGDRLLGGGEVWYWVFYLVSLGAQLGISWAFMPRVETAYALAYEALKPNR